MKYIFSIILVLSIAFVSCDQDNMGTIYEPEITYVAFRTSVVPENILSAEHNFSVSVQIVRSDASTPTTAEVTLEMNDDIDGVFALESNTVTFADGEQIAYAKIVPVVEPALIDPTKMYSFKLTLTGDNVSQFFNTTTYTAFFEIEYAAAGSGTFVSEFFEDQWSVEILKAELGDGVFLYKAKGLYEGGYDIVIVVNGNNVTVSDQAAWYYDDEYGDVFVSGTGTLNEKVLTLSLTHYIPDVYAWDAATEILTLP